MAYGFLPPQLPLLSPYDCRVSGCPRRRKRLGGRLLELARSGEELIDDGRVGQRLVARLLLPHGGLPAATVEEPGQRVGVRLGLRGARGRGGELVASLLGAAEPGQQLAAHARQQGRAAERAGAGQVVEDEVVCADDAKGIVGTYTLPPGVVSLGNDPRPKTRSFKLLNTSGAPATATCSSRSTARSRSGARWW